MGVHLCVQVVRCDQPQGAAVAGNKSIFDCGDRVGAVVGQGPRYGDAIAVPETVGEPTGAIETGDGVVERSLIRKV